MVLQDMQSAKAAVAAQFNKEKMKGKNLEAALAAQRKEKEDQAVKHKASHFTCVCRAKQGCCLSNFADFCVSGCRISVFAGFAVSMLSACVLLCVTTACMCCTFLSCLLRCLKTSDGI